MKNLQRLSRLFLPWHSRLTHFAGEDSAEIALCDRASERRKWVRQPHGSGLASVNKDICGTCFFSSCRKCDDARATNC